MTGSFEDAARAAVCVSVMRGVAPASMIVFQNGSDFQESRRRAMPEGRAASKRTEIGNVRLQNSVAIRPKGRGRFAGG